MSQRNRMGPEAPPRALPPLTAFLAVLMGWAVAPALAEEVPAVQLLGVERAPGTVVFDLALAEGLPEKQATELDQGERVSVTWQLELVRDRRLWFNTTVAKLEVEASAVYDPLTKRYSLARLRGKEALESAEAGRRDEAVDWLTRLAGARVEVAGKALDKPRLRWRVRAALDRKLVLLIFPTTVETDWTRGDLDGLSEASPE